MSQLIHLNAARQSLLKASTFDEVKDIRDKSETLRAYCKAAGESLEIQNQCAALKLEAERRAGEMLASAITKGGDSKLHDVTLKSVGIERHQSSRWQRIASIPEAQFRDYINSTIADRDELSSAGALRLARDLSNRDRDRQLEQAEPVELHFVDFSSRDVKFKTVYADPPWSYGNQGTRAATGNHYPTMPIEDIAAMPVRDIIDDESLLFLWTTNGFLQDALNEVIPSWGFEFKSMIVWCKPQIGIGNYVRNSHELLLIANRGGMLPMDACRTQKSWVVVDRERHSQKPRQFREIVESLSPNPRIELFARERRDGWTCYGNQIGVGGLFGGTVP